MKVGEDMLQLQRSVRQIIEHEINPYVESWEQAGIFPANTLFPKLGALGLLGVTKPLEFGGQALDYRYEIMVAEALGEIQCGGVPMAIGVQTNMATPALARHGSDELKREFLQPAISGECVAAIAVSEPHAGSDVAAIKTHARRDGDDYIVNGSKMWITNATQADFFCVLVNTDGDDIHSNKSLLIVPANAKGVSVGTRLIKQGMRCSDTAPVYFDEVRIPARFRIGEQGSGFTYQMQQFQEERLFGAAMILRGLEQCIEHTAEYTSERKIAGAPLISNQVVQFELAELQTEIESLRALIYRATDLYVSGGDVTRLASMAKLKAGRLCRQVPDKCLQFWGGMGYVESSLINRLYRDYRLVSIGGGADEVMLGIIAKTMGFRRSASQR